ncbi:MAG: DUF547 domain-containing protein [Gammaproteobacteria bacterium]|nr:DUF547 domain-containing protein [Gammaproteobacteria bacterium]
MIDSPLNRHRRRQRRRRNLLLVLVVTFLAVATHVHAAEPDWSAWDAVLADHVTRGAKHDVELNLVDYPAIAADPRFASVVETVENYPLAQLDGQAEQLAFLINAYNVFAVKMVADHLPLESIKDVGSFFSPVWKKPAGSLGGETVSLDDIEHGRLRKMGEPRIHMAIVCASVSCPDLRAEAYRAASLDSQLDDQARTFLANPAKGLRIEGDTVHTTQIFDWFEDDFDTLGGVAAFVRRYHELPADADIDADIDYDWSLNGS